MTCISIFIDISCCCIYLSFDLQLLSFHGEINEKYPLFAYINCQKDHNWLIFTNKKMMHIIIGLQYFISCILILTKSKASSTQLLQVFSQFAAHLPQLFSGNLLWQTLMAHLCAVCCILLAYFWHAEVCHNNYQYDL